MNDDIIKPPTVSRCPKCGYVSGGKEACEACGTVLPPVHKYLVTGPRRSVPIKREATGGWLMSALMMFGALILCLAGLWYFLAPEIGNLRAKISTAISRRVASATSAKTEVPAKQSGNVRTTDHEASPQKTPAPSAPPTVSTMETPAPQAIKTAAAVVGKFFGLSATESDEEGDGSSATSPRGGPQIEFPAEVTPRPLLFPRSNRRSSDPKAPIVLQEGSFSTGRGGAGGGDSSRPSTQEVRRAINAWGGSVMVAPTPFSNEAPSVTPSPGAGGGGDGVPAVKDLTEQTFDAAVRQSSLPVVVDFWAPWCAPCRAFNPVMESVAQGMVGRVNFYRVNADENKALARRYQVDALPTVMVFRGGTVQKRAEGGMSAQMFRSWVDAGAN